MKISVQGLGKNIQKAIWGELFHIGKISLVTTGVVVSVIFIGFNIYFSQSISPLYFQFIKEDSHSVVDFLRAIKAVPEFSNYLINQESIYGAGMDAEVYADERERQQTILRLESVLKRNPKARDVLYSLHLLYKEEQNEQKAQEYLKKAQEIDPQVEQNY